MHRLRFSIVPCVSIIAIFASVARSDDTSKVKTILKQADDATKAVKSVSYEGEFHGEGGAAVMPKVEGTVKAAKGRRGGLLSTLIGGSGFSHAKRITAKVTYSGRDDSEEIDAATPDNKNVTVLDAGSKSYTVGSQGFNQLNKVNSILMLEFVHATPFTDELNAKSVKLEGEEKVGDTDCYIIYVVYQNNTETRWAFGKDDHLPRRCERIGHEDGREGKTVLTVKNLKVNVDFDEAVFTPRPEGWEQKQPVPVSDPSLIAVGKDAPNWTLKTPDEKSVELKSLRGNVVVMDFWATWCGPCKMAMPGIQKLHEKYKDKPVKILGISCRERGNADPAKYMKSKNFTYGLLVDGTDVAADYMVEGIPTFYVIDQEGKVAFAASGYSPSGDEQLATIIEGLLKKTED